MDKFVKIRMISKASWLLGEYEPVTQFSNPQLFMNLHNKFEDFENWNEAEKISKEEFEQHLDRDENLVDAYLDVFSKKATYYKCIINDEPRYFQYFIMKKNKGIVLLYYQNVEIIEL